MIQHPEHRAGANSGHPCSFSSPAPHHCLPSFPFPSLIFLPFPSQRTSKTGDAVMTMLYHTKI